MDKNVFKVKEIKIIGVGTRVSIDFIDELGAEEYVLVGNASVGMVGVLSESRYTENYPPRKFRVNAGAAMQYVYCGEGRVRYLSELEAGDLISVYSPDSSREVAVGRVKKEKREFLRIVLENENMTVSTTLQNSDSVYLVANNPKSVIDLELEDEVFLFDTGMKATHKGEAIEGYIEEK